MAVATNVLLMEASQKRLSSRKGVFVLRLL